MRTSSVAFFTFWLSAWWVYAQPPGIESAEFVIEKERENKLPEASRTFEKVQFQPSWQRDTSLQRTLPFRFIEIRQSTLAPLSFSGQAQSYRPQSEPIETGTRLQLGFGNYTSPFISLQHTQLPSEELSYFVDFLHRSSGTGPTGDNKSADAYNRLHVGSRHRLHRSWMVAPTLRLERQGIHFYGYAPDQLETFDKKDLKQYLQSAEAEVHLQSINPKSALRVEAKPNLYFFGDRFAARELTFQLPIDFQYQQVRFWQAGLQTDWLYNRRTDSSRVLRHLVKLRPYFNWQKNNWQVQAAFRLTLDNDTSLNNAIQVYPDVSIAYHFLVDFTLRAGIRGDMQAVTLRSLTQQNPWLGKEIQLLHTHMPLDVYGSLQITPSPNWRIEPGFSIRLLQYQPFFLNQATDSARFQVVYNQQIMQQTQISLDASYRIQQKLHIELMAAFWNYQLNRNENTLTQAIHLPTWQLDGRIVWTPLPKWQWQWQSTFIGGIQAQRPGGQIDTLQPILDLSIYTHYQLSPAWGIFAQAANILSQSYSRYLYYPSRKLTFIGGLSYRF